MKRLAVFLAVAAAGCSPAQMAADQAKIRSLVNANAVDVNKTCAAVLATANSPVTELIAVAVPIVAQVQAAVKGGCGSAEGLAALAQSATTVPWLGTADTVMKTKGAVLPPPVAPAPITATTALPGV